MKGVSLALGGGGIRGVAHVMAIEALDELGVPVVSITGASIGAIVGAMRAAGIAGADMRRLVLDIAGSRMGVVRTLMDSKGVDVLHGMWGSGWAPVQGRNVLLSVLPKSMPNLVEDLAIPMTVVVTDLDAERTVDFTSGPLLDLLAASSAIPGLMRPVRIDGRTYVDGAVLDPVPVRAKAEDVPTVAIDLTGLPVVSGELVPRPLAMAHRTVHMMLRRMAADRLAHTRPEIVLRPAVSFWSEMEFHRAREIVGALEPFKDEVKKSVETLFESLEA